MTIATSSRLCFLSLSSSTMNRTATVLTVAGVSLLAYAVYFDYKRRNDVAFRKKLRKDKKKVDKTVAQSTDVPNASPSHIGPVGEAELRAALEKVQKDQEPATPEEKEAYFMTQVNLGEQLCAQAICFYRALRVYPSPMELIIIYQRTMPEPVFKVVYIICCDSRELSLKLFPKLVMEMTNLEVSNPSPTADNEDEQNNDTSEDETSPSRRGPPSEASSQDWDKVTDPGSQTPATT
ncbi:hypothetical protein EW146_g5224 [Bondarzewia mesenterica]|uniref:Mitochondrial import receptor subunit TOM20 n=1 Tax=Bondarzewia mesenterica TaxID=1095465 RepID=A0A4S4LSQ8_9AGAM|nr:hypothetical protein EW146_g5224 [Bondarzewia mesenterica]